MGNEVSGRVGRQDKRAASIQSLALVEGGVTPNDFAMGVTASHNMLNVFADVSSDDHSTSFEELRNLAAVALDYIAAYRSGTVVRPL